MNTEKKKDLIALRNWALSILGIAIIVGVGVVLLSSDDSADPVEVRPYDPADTLDAADMESPVDWLGASNGKPAGSTGAPEPAAAKPAAPGADEPQEAQSAEPAEDVVVETITPARAPASTTPAPTSEGGQ